MNFQIKAVEVVRISVCKSY